MTFCASKLTIQAHSNVIWTLSTLQCDGKVSVQYLESGSDDKTLKIWDLQNDSAIKTKDNGYGWDKVLKSDFER